MSSLRSSLLVSALVLAVIPLAPQSVAAAVGSWSQIGPFGGQIHAVVFDPGSASTAYAATGGDGVFRTTDGGATWKRGSQGLADLFVTALAIDPSRPRTLYAGTQAGLSRSTDGGGRWVPAGISRLVDRVVVAPSSPRVLYALSDSFGGLKRSDDGGAHWRDLATPPETLRLSWIAVDPSTPETAYLRRLDSGRRWGLYKTTDGGATWRRLEGFVPEAENPGPEQRFQLEVAPDRPATLIVSITYDLHSAEQTLVMRSTDGGESWTRPEGAGGFPLLVLPAGRVLTDRAASRDFGATWEPRPGAGRFGISLAAHPSRPDHLLFATETAGVWRSTDDGGEWTASSFGITAVAVHDLAVGADSTLHAVASGTVWKSGDGGARWEDLAPTSEVGRGPGFVSRVGIHPRRPRLLYVALADLSEGNVVRTDNGGASWTALESLRPLASFGGFLGDFAFDPRSPGSVFAVTDWPAGGCRTFQSADRGQSARCMPLGLASDVEVDPVDPKNVYAIRVEPLFERIAKSTDGGATWTTSGFNRGLPNTLTYTILAHAPGASGHLFLGTREGSIFRTTDGGRSWRPANGNLQRYGKIQGLVVDPRNPALVYAAIGLQGVFRSRDGGRRWSPIANGLSYGSLNIDAPRIPLTLDPRDPDTLYVGSERRGLFAITLTD